jgi:16S rRNA (guanine966-N2)-methyltransferase
MRIIGGEWGGRRLHPPPDMPYTRPTTDLAKEGLFNILQHQLVIGDLKTLDLFGGTGSITYELASRGAKDLTIVEKDTAMYNFIRKTADTLKIQNLKLVKSDAFRFIQDCKSTFDFIFAGPPYALKNIDDLPRLVEEKKLLNPGGWFVLEHTPRNNYEGWPMFAAARNYGTTIFSFFVRRPVESIE